MPEAQKAEHGAHLRLPGEIAKLEKHIEHFKSVGDEREAAVYTERLKHTKDGLVHALKAKELVDQLGLSHDVTPTTITYNDALHFVAKALHETQHGVTKSLYARAHGHLKHVKGTRLDDKGNVADADEHHVDHGLLNAARDAAAEVITHLGLTDPAHVSAVNSFFGKAQ